jgi:hypothetical protein
MTPIERAAEALHNHIHHDCEYAAVGIFAQKLWQARARAVLKALREPSGGMVAVGFEYLAGYDPTQHDVYNVWQVMIDAALGDSIDTAQLDG